MSKFTVGQKVFVVGKPGIPYGVGVTVLKTIPGVGYACGVGRTTLLVEPNFLASRIIEVAA